MALCPRSVALQAGTNEGKVVGALVRSGICALFLEKWMMQTQVCTCTVYGDTNDFSVDICHCPASWCLCPVSFGRPVLVVSTRGKTLWQEQRGEWFFSLLRSGCYHLSLHTMEKPLLTVSSWGLLGCSEHIHECPSSSPYLSTTADLHVAFLVDT